MNTQTWYWILLALLLIALVLAIVFGVLWKKCKDQSPQSLTGKLSKNKKFGESRVMCLQKCEMICDNTICTKKGLDSDECQNCYSACDQPCQGASDIDTFCSAKCMVDPNNKNPTDIADCIDKCAGGNSSDRTKCLDSCKNSDNVTGCIINCASGGGSVVQMNPCQQKCQTLTSNDPNNIHVLIKQCMDACNNSKCENQCSNDYIQNMNKCRQDLDTCTGGCDDCITKCSGDDNNCKTSCDPKDQACIDKCDTSYKSCTDGCNHQSCTNSCNSAYTKTANQHQTMLNTCENVCPYSKCEQDCYTNNIINGTGSSSDNWNNYYACDNKC